MYKSIQTREDTEILVVSRKEKRLIRAANNTLGNIRTTRKTAKDRKQKQEEKQLYGYFKRQTSKIAHEKTWTWLIKGKFQVGNIIFFNSSA